MGAEMGNLKERIATELKTAIKDQDRRTMCTLRLVTAAINDRNISARTNGKDSVSDDDVTQILAKMIKQREESEKAFAEGGRLELAEQEREEIEIIRRFLPRQLDDDEVLEAIDDAVTECGASCLKDMGRTMTLLKERYPGQMNFAQASKVVKEKLAGPAVH